MKVKLRLHSITTRYLFTSFASFLLGCLSHVTLFGNSALSYIKMNVYGCYEVYTHVLYSLTLYYAFRLFVSCVVVRQLSFIVHQNECLRLHSFRTRYIHMYFTRLRFITHLDCLSRPSLFGNSALSCIRMNVCGCILLERGIYTCTLLACALLRI